MSDQGWIARDVADRILAEHHDVKVQDWRAFAIASGFQLIRVPLSTGRGSFMIGKTIFLHNRLSDTEEEEAVCHELCHRYMHACNMFWWEGRPYGKYIVSKYERQARELANLLR